tara:strand:- start:10 stop:222 length:213 start_codon:yes stop_codon:yes gene_type:complete
MSYKDYYPIVGATYDYKKKFGDDHMIRVVFVHRGNPTDEGIFYEFLGKYKDFIPPDLPTISFKDFWHRYE